MNSSSQLLPRILRLSCRATGIALLCAAGIASAQSLPRVRPAVQPPAPTAAARMPVPSTVGLPSATGLTLANAEPAGLTAPNANPTGLASQYPAGLPSNMPNPAGLSSILSPDLTAPATAPGTPAVQPGAYPVARGGGYIRTAAAPGTVPPAGAAYTAQQIAQSFINADANRDGELTRAEAQRLTIMPFDFEDMDLNHDGVLTRSEYEDAFRR